jgi:hypothetical protein
MTAQAIGRACPAPHTASAAVERCAVAFTAMAVLSLGLVSPEFLDFLGFHYISSGGSGFEKLHPATYLAVAAFMLLLTRRADPVGEVDRLVSNAKLLLVYLFACALLTFQCLVLERPSSAVIDTFLLPALLCLLVWSLPSAAKPLTVAVHAVVWINIAIGFYEYFAGHRLVPITLGNLVVTGDWRSTALLGHPLAAAGVVAMYAMALLLGPGGGLPRGWRIAAIAAAVCSLMVFGGRTALVAVLVVAAGLAVTGAARLIRGDRFGLGSVILVTCGIVLLAVAVPILFDSGVFDRMIARFSSDQGSAHARIASMFLLSQFDWNELMLGTTPARSGALQAIAGLDYGIENFWVACIVQYGILLTALITIGLGCFFVALLKRSHPAAWVAVLFLCVVAASSVSFSSKNITLAAYTVLILALLPRRQRHAAA